LYLMGNADRRGRVYCRRSPATVSPWRARSPPGRESGAESVITDEPYSEGEDRWATIGMDSKSEFLGRMLPREKALDDFQIKEFFQIADHIVQEDPRVRAFL